jgi:hypothetical protein
MKNKMSIVSEEIIENSSENIFRFFNRWKRYWLIILCSIIVTIYGIHSFSEQEKTGNGLTISVISVAILGWLITSKAANENIRRIKRIEYLSTAYEGIALYIRRDPQGTEYDSYLDGLEKSFTIIQLYGERREIKLVCSLIEQYHLNHDGNIQCEVLLNMLRDGLRKELLLPKATRKVTTLRVNRQLMPSAEIPKTTDLFIV